MAALIVLPAMKRVAIILVVITFFLSTVPTVHVVNQLESDTLASLSLIQIYPKDHIWNVPVDTLPVHPMSATYIDSSQPSNWMGIGEDYPINIVDENTPRQYLSSIRYLPFSDNIPYPIPKNPLVGKLSDHHLLMVDTSAKMLYELYNANQNTNGTWWAESAVVFNLSDYTLRPDNWPSADAAGLPILPGTIRYDEVDSGSINHALRLALPTSGDAHVWPARAGGVRISGSYPPMGQRFRLNESFDISGFNTHQKVILTALKKYGVMLADNIGPSDSFGLAAVPDARWGSDIGYRAFQSVHFSDFEAVNVSSLMINSDSGQARMIPIVPSTLTPAPTPTPLPIEQLLTGNPGSLLFWDYLQSIFNPF